MLESDAASEVTAELSALEVVSELPVSELSVSVFFISELSVSELFISEFSVSVFFISVADVSGISVGSSVSGTISGSS